MIEQQNQNGRNSPLTFERAAELMLAETNGSNCEGRVQVEFLARPLQLLAHMENGSCSPGNRRYNHPAGLIDTRLLTLAEFLNPIPRDELMEESGLFSIQDPFPQMEEHHQTNQCQIQVVSK